VRERSVDSVDITSSASVRVSGEETPPVIIPVVREVEEEEEEVEAYAMVLAPRRAATEFKIMVAGLPDAAPLVVVVVVEEILPLASAAAKAPREKASVNTPKAVSALAAEFVTSTRGLEVVDVVEEDPSAPPPHVRTVLDAARSAEVVD